MSNTFGDHNAAVRLREFVRAVAQETVLDMIPRPRYATVTAVDNIAGRATVQYPDEVGNTFTVPTSQVAPLAAGCVVRIAGQAGARYVDEVMSGGIRIRGLNRVELVDSVQSIASATNTDITWSAAEVLDTDNWATVGSATLTCPTGKSGRYLVTFSGVWASATLGTLCGVTCLYNGAVAYGSNGLTPQGVHTLSFGKFLTAADTLKFQVYQNSGAAVNCTSRLDLIPLP